MEHEGPAHVVTEAGEGRSIPRPQTGGTVTIKIDGRQSGGTVTVYTSQRMPGDDRGPGMHAHPAFDETFYVLEGEYEFTVGSQKLPAREGTTVFVPRGTFHDFRAVGSSASRLLTFCTPGGIEDLFEDLARAGAPCSPDGVGDIHRKHGFTFTA